QTGRAATPTFIPPDFVGRAAGHYELLASPTLHSGQEVAARVLADGANGGPVRVALYLSHYDGDDCLVCVDGRPVTLAPGAEARVTWRVPDTGGQPIAEIGLAVASGDDGPAAGTVYLDWLTWQGEPHVYLVRPADGGTMWRRAWVDAVDHVEWHRREAFRVMQDHGAGLFMQGGGDWRDYSVEALVVPHAAAAAGLAARVQGLKRFYSLELGADQVVRLVRSLERGRTVLAERPFPFAWDAELVFQLEVAGPRLRAWIDGGPLFDLEDAGTPLRHGAVGIVVEEGRVSGEWVEVRPLTQANLGASPSAAADLAP
ncbi:MAG: hypothetical protein LBS56_09715, partial [Propionibacteriaceae bacterium]|nr:hypothetical protein [Propionibacteriaceae bacterium]